MLAEAALCRRNSSGGLGFVSQWGRLVERVSEVPENAETGDKTWRDDQGGKLAALYAPWR